MRILFWCVCGILAANPSPGESEDEWVFDDSGRAGDVTCAVTVGWEDALDTVVTDAAGSPEWGVDSVVSVWRRTNEIGLKSTPPTGLTLMFR